MSSVVISGDTSGQVTLAAPAVAGSNTITLPASTGTAIISDASANIQFNSGYGSVATAYGCRAWVNFNGTTASPSTIRGSGNVTSVTKNATGDYTVNFTTAMPDANYGFSGGGNASGTGSDARGPVITQHTTMSTSAFRFYTNRNGDNGANPVNIDYSIVCVDIFR
jgi:hypothetical protein